MRDLVDHLARRGYRVVPPEAGDVWRFRTRWRRGEARGEIGSLLYTLVATTLRETKNE